MSRTIIVALGLAIILSAIALGGCSKKTEQSTITGNVSVFTGYGSAVSHVLIAAVPSDGSAPVYTISDDNGNYSLNVKPGIRYNMSGLSYDPYGQYSMVFFRYADGNYTDGITLAPGEKVALQTTVSWHHPPMGLIRDVDPKTGNETSIHSTPVSTSGHVYLDGKALGGAMVEAVPMIYGHNNTSNTTSGGGAYVLGLDSKVQYYVTATYQGLRYTIWPIYLEDNEAGVYDFNLTRTQRSVLAGTAPGDEPWLSQPGDVTIEAIPVGGGKNVTATIGPDFSYSLDVEPFVYYDIRGKFRGPNGKYYDLMFTYQTGVVFSGFTLHPNETALTRYIPSMSYYLDISPTPRPGSS